MSVETRLRQLEERMKEQEEKMEYVWMGFMHFIKSVGKAKSIAEALSNQSSPTSVKGGVK